MPISRTSAPKEQSPKHYVLVANDSYDASGRRRAGLSSAQARLKIGRWEIYATTRNRKQLAVNDRLAIYIAGQKTAKQCFVATATISEIELAARSRRATLDEENVEVTLILNAIKEGGFVSIHSLSDRLSFFPKNNKKWGAVLMGGCRLISSDDFSIIEKALFRK